MKQNAFILELYVSESGETTYLLRRMVSQGTVPLCASSSLNDVSQKISEFESKLKETEANHE